MSGGCIRRLAVAVVALVVYAFNAEAQQVGVLTHNAPLRSGPSSSSGKVAALQAGAAVTLLGNGHRAGYLRVRAQSEDVGWVFEHYVRLIDPTAVHQPTSPHTLHPAPTVVPVSQGDFDTCPDSGNAKPANVRALNRLKNPSAAPQ